MLTPGGSMTTRSEWVPSVAGGPAVAGSRAGRRRGNSGTEGLFGRLASLLAELPLPSPEYRTPLVYFAVLVIAASFHSTFWEWGGVMQVFEGREILHGQGIHGWASHFWPPLFALLTGIGGLVMPAFTAGKIIGACSSASLLLVTYKLALLMFGDRREAILSQVFVALNPLYAYESFQAHNHMLDAFLFVSGLYLFLTSLRTHSLRAMVCAGALCGLAALSRYQSLVLLALPVVLLLRSARRDALRYSTAFFLAFAAVSSPWWIYNTIQNGSPFNTWEYLNLGAVLFPGERARWWWNAQSAYHGTLDLIKAFPGSYARNSLYNLGYCAKAFLAYGGITSVFVIPGIYDSILTLDRKVATALYTLSGCMLILVCQVFLPNYELLSSIVLFTPLSVAFGARYSGQVARRLPRFTRIRVEQVLFGCLLLAGLTLTLLKCYLTLRDPSAGGVLPEARSVARVLRHRDPAIGSKVVMAIDPGVAYHAGSEYLETPGYFEGSLDDMVNYRGLSREVRSHAAKYPSNLPDSLLRADYLYYTRVTSDPLSPFPESEPAQFSFLFDTSSSKIPADFRLVYRSDDAVVYEITRGK